MQNEVCYRDKADADRIVALAVGMSDENIKKMLEEHPSYYESVVYKEN